MKVFKSCDLTSLISPPSSCHSTRSPGFLPSVVYAHSVFATFCEITPLICLRRSSTSSKECLQLSAS
jgi:hypothetical protein